MIQYGDHVNDHENIRVRVRGRGQNPWSTQQKKLNVLVYIPAIDSILNLVPVLIYY